MTVCYCKEFDKISTNAQSVISFFYTFMLLREAQSVLMPIFLAGGDLHNDSFHFMLSMSEWQCQQLTASG
jgi:hypothetical protein